MIAGKCVNNGEVKKNMRMRTETVKQWRSVNVDDEDTDSETVAFC
jgi:hypothetical protein